MKILLIDNYDSYTYNLVQYFRQITGFFPIVLKNDACSYEALPLDAVDAVVLSPGPGTPERDEDFGVCRALIERCTLPMLGVCLGHQGIGLAYGARVVPAPECMHGRTSRMEHDGTGLFRGLPSPLEVMRYHSLVLSHVPEPLVQNGWVGEIPMAIAHPDRALYGVQFHPESIATPEGMRMLENFVLLARQALHRMGREEHIGMEVRNPDAPRSKVSGAPCRQAVEVHLMGKMPGDILERVVEAHGEGDLIWLDSNLREDGESRYSMVGFAGPASYRLEARAGHKAVRIENDGTVVALEDSIFDVLSAVSQRYEKPSGLGRELPFHLGLVGYIGYGMTEETLCKVRHEKCAKDACFRFIDRALVYDHDASVLYALHLPGDGAWMDELGDIRSSVPIPSNAHRIALLFLETSEAEYKDAIRRCQEYIRRGESYEICLTNRLRFTTDLPPKAYYQTLREMSPAPYSAFMRMGDISIASSSMERFLRLRDGTVTTKPIKGTLPRGRDAVEDAALAKRLREDDHFRAENYMIVDLLRNDLGKISRPGTVRVTRLLEVERYASLFQLVSTVEAVPEEGVRIGDILRALFPGGSMTGAPKRRTVEIIDALETSARGVYSGVIGYVSTTGDADFSIVIRTAVFRGGQGSIGVGGAILATSDPDSEFQEILLKAKGSLATLRALTMEEIQL